ncbi:unnamed protein product, partial [Ixodes hexagonus]
QVNVTVFYDATCRDCRYLIKKQLWPVYQELSNHMDVDLVPYGLSEMKKDSSGNVTFVCRIKPGDAECLSNILHCCAIELYPDTKQNLEFIACIVGASNFAKAVPRCAQKIKGMDAKKLLDCANSTQGRTLFQKMGGRTAAMMPAITRVPSVVIDGRLLSRRRWMSQQDFKATVCRHLKPTVPKECWSDFDRKTTTTKLTTGKP